MNKVINSLTLLVLFAYCFFAIGSINDLNFSVYSIRSIPFLPQIVFGLTGVVFLLGLLRIKRHWEGVRDIKSFSKFIYSTPISKKSINLATVFFISEVIFLSFFLAISYNAYLLDKGFLLIPMFGVLGFLIVEILFFLYKLRTSKEIFKLGVNTNLVAYFEREMHIYYFDGLQQISVYQNRLHFKYKKGLHMFLELDLIPEDELYNFKTALNSVLKDKPLFFDESYREFGEK
jgi:hypothetical protein